MHLDKQVAYLADGAEGTIRVGKLRAPEGFTDAKIVIHCLV